MVGRRLGSDVVRFDSVYGLVVKRPAWPRLYGALYTQRGTDMNRREFLKSLAASGALIAAPGLAFETLDPNAEILREFSRTGVLRDVHLYLYEPLVAPRGLNALLQRCRLEFDACVSDCVLVDLRNSDSAKVILCQIIGRGKNIIGIAVQQENLMDIRRNSLAMVP